MDLRRRITLLILTLWINLLLLGSTLACIFRTQDGLETEAEGVRFIRVREDLPLGNEILLLRAYPRSSIVLRGMERSTDHRYFKINEINATTVQILLNKSLDDLVDQDVPQNLLKFRILCTGNNGRIEETAFMSITVYVEDINDHAPVFLNKPYEVNVDESTPVGTVVFQGIQAFDRDKPNTPNSDVHVTIGQIERVPGGPYFGLDSPHRPFVILKRQLDYDNGIRQFNLPIIASDRGTPVRHSNTTLKILIKDHDDLPPKFTEGIYRTKINEFFPLTGKPIRKAIYFSPPIFANDQDSLNATLVYDIISGNERQLFRVNSNTGVISLEKEIDLEEENLPGNTFVLQLEARQKDSPLRRALARVEIEIMDLNDNPPEFEVDLYNISIVENLPSGFSVLQVNAIDRDQGENAEFFYNLEEEKPEGAFLIDPRTGWITVRDHTLLDREKLPSITMIVQAVERIPPYDDRPKDSGIVQVDITLLDSNDNTPQFENGNLYEFKVNVNAAVGSIIGKVTANDPDDGRNGMILYELQRPKGSGYIPFRLDSHTGTIFVSGPLRKGRIALFVEATDQPINPSERRFSLAVVTIEVHATTSDDTIEFLGSPYEFWVGADVSVGTSVGQVRTTLDFDGSGEIMYDLLHSYPEGVPFAIEERSGIVTVIRNLDDFDRTVYYFEAVANYQASNKPIGRLVRRTSRQEKQITKSGEVIEIDEGVISDTENVLVTNVTVHIVSPDDERGILMRGTNLNPIEFHIKENLSGAAIGRLLYKNSTRSTSNTPNFKDLIGQASRSEQMRQNRHITAKFNRNNTNFFSLPNSNVNKVRRNRDLNREEGYDVFVTPSIVIEDSLVAESSNVHSFVTPPSRRASTWRPKSVKEGALRRHSNVEHASASTPSVRSSPYTQTPSTVSVYRRISRNETLQIDGFEPNKSFKQMERELQIEGTNNRPKTAPEKPVGLRFLIANQQDVMNKITITDDGTLMTLNGLDREARDTYRLTVIAEYSKGFVSGAGIYQVNIYVDDVNDNAPEFESPAYSGIIYENSPAGTEVLLNRPIKVTDIDAGKNAQFTLTLSGDGSSMFAVEFVNGSLTTKQKKSNATLAPFLNSHERMDIEKNFMTMHLVLWSPNQTYIKGPYYKIKYVGAGILDRERENLYHLNLIAKDTGGLISSVKLNLLVADVNDNAPMFEKILVFKDPGIEILEYTDELEISFVEKMSPSAAMLKATPSQKITMLGEYGSIGGPRNSNSSQSRTQRLRRGGYRRNTGRQARKIKSAPIFSILESVPVGSTVLKVTATDEDSDKNSQIFYEISAEDILPIIKAVPKTKSMPHFSIDRVSGEIKINHPLPAETKVAINITAKDIGGLSDTIRIEFKVKDVNNHAPVFKKSWYSFDLEEGTYFDQTVDKIEATDEDFGRNANLTYQIHSKQKVPFYITPKSGVLKVTGDLDREQSSQYEFHVVALDNAAEGTRMSSSVEVEINVLDVNDNAPEFIGYDDMVTMTMSNEVAESARKLITDEGLTRMQLLNKIPVYKAYLSRSTVPGTFVKQIAAIDKDYQGNGNGLVMFSLLHHKMPHLFEIDSRDGTITTISKFSRYNGYEHVNLSIVASDLGSPSKSATAMLLVNLQGEDVFDESEMDLFPHKYFEIEVPENNNYPLELVRVNISAMFLNDLFRWSIVPEPDESGIDAFSIEPKNGTVYVVKPFDRETKDEYRIKIRAEKIGRESRNLPTLTYPIHGERIQGLQENEVRIVVRVGDVNDNAPKFRGNGRPIVSVIPNSANFGFPVTRVEAFDLDIGYNAEIRYKLLNEPSRLFGIDEKNGKIRVLGSIPGDQRVYGFDVKATDRNGADDGMSSIANVFVYVLDENRQVRLVIAGKPFDVEKELDSLTNSLSMATGMDVRVRLLEPHLGGMEPATDAYIYAVDPKTNSIVDMEDLQYAMSIVDMTSLSISPSAQILELSELGKYRARTSGKTGVAGMSGTELASIILAVVVFAGGLATSLCVICVRYRRRRTLPRSDTGLSYSIAPVTSTLGTGRSKATTTTTSSPESKRSLRDEMVRRSKVFPGMKHGKAMLANIDDRPREYIDVPLPKSVINTNYSHMDHDTACLRFNQIHNNHSQNNDISVQSHHSSGHDSGLGLLQRERSETPSENLLRMLRERRSLSKPNCNCGRLDVNICCAGDSSDSYEDSLKNGEIPGRQHLMQPPPLPIGGPPSSSGAKGHGFRRSVRNSGRPRPTGIRHSFSGVRDDLTQQSPRFLVRPRVNSFRNSMTDLEQRLHNLEQSFREPFHLNNNSRC